MHNVQDLRHPVICTSCAEPIYPRPISVSVLDQEFRVDVDEQGRCAVCQWAGDNPEGEAA